MIAIRTRLATLATAGLAAAGLAAAGLAAAAPADAAPSAPPCSNGALAVTRSFVDSGAGHSGMIVVYRNNTSRACTVYGYPGLDAIGRDGSVLAHAKRTAGGYSSGGQLSTVTIEPYRYASAGVEWSNFDARTGGACRFSAAVNTIVANTTLVDRLPVSVSACGLQVHPTVANTPQYPRYGRAQHRWIAGSKVAAAETNSYLDRAARALKRTGRYPTQVEQLVELASIPETDVTPAQRKAAAEDIAALDQFFATPGLYL